MKTKNQWLFINTLVISAYAILAYPIMTMLLENSDTELIPAVLYVVFIVIHILIMIAASILQWIGFFARSKVLIVLTTLAVLFGSFFAAFIPLIWLLPWGVSNILSIWRKAKQETANQ